MERLNIKLEKRNYFPYWFALACCALGALNNREEGTVGLIVGALVLGPGFWFAFRGPKFLSDWSSFRSNVLYEWAELGIKLTVLFLLMWVVMPWVTEKSKLVFGT